MKTKARYRQSGTEFHRIQDIVVKFFFQIGGLVVLLILILIFWFLFKNSWNFLSQVPLKDFLFSDRWYPTSFVKQEYGILAMLMSTLLVTFGATVFAGSIGILGAVFLSEYGSVRVRNMVRYFVEIFSAVPSVVIGLIGITVVAPFLQHFFGWTDMFNGYMASLLVGVMALPTILGVSLDALDRVSPPIRIASLGLGATRWETTYKVILPSVKSGLLAALILGIGRAIGETMIVLMIGGNSLEIPKSFADPVRPLTATIAIEMGEVAQTSLHYSALFALGLLLFIFTFFVNYAVDKVSRRNPL